MESDDKPLGKVPGKYCPHRPRASVENEIPAEQRFSMWPATRLAFTRAVDNDPLAVDNLPLSAFSESSSRPPDVTPLRCRK
jgi:hypothetical protein